jgi:hypothetical protein
MYRARCSGLARRQQAIAAAAAAARARRLSSVDPDSPGCHGRPRPSKPEPSHPGHSRGVVVGRPAPARGCCRGESRPGSPRRMPLHTPRRLDRVHESGVEAGLPSQTRRSACPIPPATGDPFPEPPSHSVLVLATRCPDARVWPAPLAAHVPAAPGLPSYPYAYAAHTCNPTFWDGKWQPLLHRHSATCPERDGPASQEKIPPLCDPQRSANSRHGCAPPRSQPPAPHASHGAPCSMPTAGTRALWNARAHRLQLHPQGSPDRGFDWSQGAGASL